LAALADAARYRRRSGLAREALLAQRARFPESRRALDAAFLLGRVEEEQPTGTTRAVAWYDEYLARAPEGSYAAEALVRKMTIFKGSSSPAAAAAVAREYLRRFPAGRYAGSARALLGER
jgi:TolA-binding protein